MNASFAREVGYIRYIFRRILWRIAPPKELRLHTGVMFPLPRDKFFSSDVFVTRCNVDWNSEYILAAYLSSEKAKGDFLDVGAHIGYYSCLCSPFVNRTWAFEPDKRNHVYLRKALDGIRSAELVAKAVSNANGEIRFSDGDESSVSHIALEDQENTTSVPAVTLDSFIEEVGANPSAIKMDIEGFEILALQGAESSLERFKSVLLIEYNQEAGRPNTWAGLHELVESAGYTVFAVTREPAGWCSYTYEFKNRPPSDFAKLSSKMLFLVPNSKRAWFDSLGSKYGTWGNKGLHPRQVRSFLADFGA